MAKKIFATDTEINEFLKSAQEQLIEESRHLKKRKFQTEQFEGVTLNFKLKEFKDDRKAKLRFTEKAWIKIFALIHTYSTEVEWHGVVKRLTPDTFLVEDILIFPHEVTSATVISDQTEYEKWLDKLDNDTFNSLRFHGHSHVNMGVTPSSVDMTYRKNILNNFGTPTQNADFFYIFLIFNKKDEISGEIYDLKNNAIYSTDEIAFVTDECDWLTSFLTEAKNVVKERTYSYSGSSYAGSTSSPTSSVSSSYSGYNSYKAPVTSSSKRNAKTEARQSSTFDDDDIDDKYYGGIYGTGRWR